MSYGFFARGVNGQMIIDDTHSTCHVLRKGSFFVEAYTTNGDRRTINYSSPVATSMPPQVWLSLGGGVSNMLHVGSAGNWTGFSFIAVPEAKRVTLRYIASTYEPPYSGDTYGMRIFDPAGRPVFDSGYAGMVFLFATRSYARTDLGGSGWSHNYRFDTNVSYQVHSGSYYLASSSSGPIQDIGSGNQPGFSYFYGYENRALYSLQIFQYGSQPNPELWFPAIYAIPSDEL